MKALWLAFGLSAVAWSQPQLRELQPASGKAASSVHLVGSGFGEEPGNVKVFFGTVPAEITKVSDCDVTTRVPDTAPKTSEVRVEVGGVPSQVRTFECTPSVRVTVDKNPIESGEHTRGRFEVFHEERAVPITFKNASPGIVRFTAGDEQSIKTSGGANNVFEFDIEGIQGNRHYTIDYQWGAQAVELIEWKLPWTQVDWAPKK